MRTPSPICKWRAFATAAATTVLLMTQAAAQARVPDGIPIAHTPDISLLVTYHTINIGNDGVQREASYSRIMHRKDGKVWLEKDVPQAIKDSLAHGHTPVVPRGPHAGHAHTEAQDAPILVQRDDASAIPKVQVVLHKMRRLIDVEQAHHGNVGFNGSWDATYWLIPPASLGLLHPVGNANDGVQIFRRFEDESMTEVAWNKEQQFPQRVLRRGAHNTTYYKMTATPIPTPETLPWEMLGDYEPGDYADLLD